MENQHHTYYKDRRVHISLTGGPIILQLDTPLGEAEVCCTYNGLIFKRNVPQDIVDVINGQLEISQSRENGVLTVITLPWVDEVKEGYYTNASPKTLRVPKGFGECYASTIYVVNPTKKDYVKLFMLNYNEHIFLSDDETLQLDENFSELNKSFIYEAKGKRLLMRVEDTEKFVDTMIEKVGGNWFMPFINYATDDDSSRAVVIRSADEIDTITIVTEEDKDKYHIYMGDNNYREFESLPDSFITDTYVDGTVHYARKRDYLAVLLSKNNNIEYALVYNATETRFTGSHTRQELRDAEGIPVDLRDFSFGRKLPTLKEAIDELIKTHRKHKIFMTEGHDTSDIKKSQFNRKKFMPLASMFGRKK